MIRESKSNVLIADSTIATSAVTGNAIDLGTAFKEGTGVAYIPESYHPYEDKGLRVQVYVDSITTTGNLTLTLMSKATGASSFTNLVTYLVPSANLKAGMVLDEVLPNCIENTVNASLVMSAGSCKARVELFANV